MRVTFDPNKDALNATKHGVPLSRAGDMVIDAIVPARTIAGEARFRAYGLLDGNPYGLVFTVRETGVRAISLRRTSQEEYDEHVQVHPV